MRSAASKLRDEFYLPQTMASHRGRQQSGPFGREDADKLASLITNRVSRHTHFGEMATSHHSYPAKLLISNQLKIQMDTLAILREAAKTTFPEIPLPEKIIASAETKLLEKIRHYAPAVITQAVLESARKPARKPSKKGQIDDPKDTPSNAKADDAKPHKV